MGRSLGAPLSGRIPRLFDGVSVLYTSEKVMLTPSCQHYGIRCVHTATAVSLQDYPEQVFKMSAALHTFYIVAVLSLSLLGTLIGGYLTTLYRFWCLPTSIPVAGAEANDALSRTVAFMRSWISPYETLRSGYEKVQSTHGRCPQLFPSSLSHVANA
jgi:hypothetical protein